ncbi:MAG: DsrE family protein [Halothiobacillaceae bacterium]|jgi:intracellular sulfur oxidation DsrE/DsrF family protein|nr:DsrE family protein [Halothiobacillaceae bacterium]MDY0050247.1 DsrE family protein [Halothiobacillaceae bacterium]
MSQHNAASPRRGFLARLFALGGLAAVGGAQAAESAKPAEKQERFPGDPPQHKIVYQINEAEWEYQEHILNSISAMIQKYEDNVAIAVVAFGPGIHILAKQPKREVPAMIRERVKGFSENYGVRFIACGNTMSTIGWEKKDMVDFAEIEQVGAAALMELQEQGYAYLAW